ncbi:MAG: protein-glutamate O-methyltransferase CheR [Flavobacteriaceae bacterium]
MKPGDFEFFSTFLKQRSGIVIGEEKQYLLESRLTPVVRKAGLSEIADLVPILRGGRDAALATRVVEAMTTNESFFFRDKTPFEHFRDVMVPHMLETRAARRAFRVWCAAASTGQEPYSLAITIKELASSLANWRIEIVGTDLSSDVIEKAKAGIYSQFEVQRGLPIQTLLKYFEQKGEIWQIASMLRAMVQYRVFNLLDDYAALGKFDVIFCRNVLIYFDHATKKDILQRLSRCLTPDGFLVLGAAETVVGISDAYETVPERRGLYRLKGAAAEPAIARPFASLRTGTDGRPAAAAPVAPRVVPFKPAVAG